MEAVPGPFLQLKGSSFQAAGLMECPHEWAQHCEHFRKVGTVGQSYKFLERKKYITKDQESAWLQVF